MKFIRIITLAFYTLLVLILNYTVLYPINASTLSNFPNELDNNEISALSALMNKKLNITRYDYEIISGFSDTNRFVLVDNESYYLIFDRLVLDYTEFSDISHSPYYELTNIVTKKYVSPLNYYAVINGVCIDIVANRAIENNELNCITIFESEYKEYIVSCYNSATETNNNEMRTITSIDDAYYFLNLKDNIGTNSPDFASGSCGYVALEMILSYFDSFIDDDVIDEVYDVSSIRSCNFYSDIDPEEYFSSPGIDDTFHTYMINLGHSYGYSLPGSNEISSYFLSLLASHYLTNQSFSGSISYPDLFENKFNFCTDAIDDNNPVIIEIKSSPDFDHFVVGYEYDDSGIFTNFGWGTFYTHININSYTIEHAFYITLSESHSHSNNYLWQLHNCSGSICPCGNLICGHQSKTYTSVSNTNHLLECNACSYSLYENHTLAYNSATSYYYCLYCNYSYYHVHNYTYIPRGDGRKHFVQCSCGINRLENCIGYIQLGSEAYCMYCGQLIL